MQVPGNVEALAAAFPVLPEGNGTRRRRRPPLGLPQDDAARAGPGDGIRQQEFSLPGGGAVAPAIVRAAAGVRHGVALAAASQGHQVGTWGSRARRAQRLGTPLRVDGTDRSTPPIPLNSGVAWLNPNTGDLVVLIHGPYFGPGGRDEHSVWMVEARHDRLVGRRRLDDVRRQEGQRVFPVGGERGAFGSIPGLGRSRTQEASVVHGQTQEHGRWGGHTEPGKQRWSLTDEPLNGNECPSVPSLSVSSSAGSQLKGI